MILYYIIISSTRITKVLKVLFDIYNFLGLNKTIVDFNVNNRQKQKSQK